MPKPRSALDRKLEALDRRLDDEEHAFQKFVRPTYVAEPLEACEQALGRAEVALNALCRMIPEVTDLEQLQSLGRRVDDPEFGPHTMAAHVSAAVTETEARLRKHRVDVCEVCGRDAVFETGLCVKHYADVSLEERSSW